MRKQIKDIRDDEIVWQQLFDTDHRLRYIITSKASRDCYFLYSLEDGVYKKVGRGKTPPELISKIEL